MTSSPTISVILPCYHPAPKWGARVAARLAGLAAQRPTWQWELVIVDDGSTHGMGTDERDALPNCQWVRLPRNMGKGAAVRAGLRVATAPVFLLTDCDLPYDDDSMLRVADALLTEADVIVAGQRPSVRRAGAGIVRETLSAAMRWMNQHVLHLAVADTQCGLKGLGLSGRALYLSTRAPGFACDIELFLRARTKHAPRIVSIPVQLAAHAPPSRLRLGHLLTELRWLGSILRHREPT